jgi:hypothetical protein
MSTQGRRMYVFSVMIMKWILVRTGSHLLLLHTLFSHFLLDALVSEAIFRSSQVLIQYIQSLFTIYYIICSIAVEHVSANNNITTQPNIISHHQLPARTTHPSIYTSHIDSSWYLCTLVPLVHLYLSSTFSSLTDIMRAALSLTSLLLLEQ